MISGIACQNWYHFSDTSNLYEDAAGIYKLDETLTNRGNIELAYKQIQLDSDKQTHYLYKVDKWWKVP